MVRAAVVRSRGHSGSLFASELLAAQLNLSVFFEFHGTCAKNPAVTLDSALDSACTCHTARAPHAVHAKLDLCAGRCGTSSASAPRPGVRVQLPQCAGAAVLFEAHPDSAYVSAARTRGAALIGLERSNLVKHAVSMVKSACPMAELKNHRRARMNTSPTHETPCCHCDRGLGHRTNRARRRAASTPSRARLRIDPAALLCYIRALPTTRYGHTIWYEDLQVTPSNAPVHAPN